MDEALVLRQNIGPEWNPTRESYAQADTDIEAAEWWAGQPHDNFARQLASSFGDHATFFACGIGKDSTCTVSGAAAYEKAGDPPWTYLSTLSVVNLHTLFNMIFDGIVRGQASFSDQIPHIAAIFFPPNDVSYALDTALTWIVAAVAILVGIPFFIPKLAAGPRFGAVASGGVAMVDAGIETAVSALDAKIQTQLGVSREMHDFSAFFSRESRIMIEEWADDTFLGRPDVLGNDILDYLQGGALVDIDVLPSAKNMEDFYTSQMVSRVINAKWRNLPIFAMFMNTTDASDKSGPAQMRYYSEQDGGVYYIYRFVDDGVLRGHLDGVNGLDDLGGAFFNISGEAITKSSAVSFRYAGDPFNFTYNEGVNLLKEAMVDINSEGPFQQGPSWPGTWTIPVCDTGANNWNVQYGNKTSRFGSLPCCCGPDCRDTKAFLEAANLKGSQTLLRGCKEQLKASSLDFESIDYGYGWKEAFRISGPCGALASKSELQLE